MKKVIVLLLVIVLCCSALAGCGSSSSVYGKYTVTGVMVDGEESKDLDMIAELYGNYANAWRNATLTLTKSGNIELNRPNDEDGTLAKVKGTFTYQDNCIELISAENENDTKILDYKDGKIYFDVSGNGMTLIFSK